MSVETRIDSGARLDAAPTGGDTLDPLAEVLDRYAAAHPSLPTARIRIGEPVLPTGREPWNFALLPPEDQAAALDVFARMRYGIPRDRNGFGVRIFGDVDPNSHEVKQGFFATCIPLATICAVASADHLREPYFAEVNAGHRVVPTSIREMITWYKDRSADMIVHEVAERRLPAGQRGFESTGRLVSYNVGPTYPLNPDFPDLAAGANQEDVQWVAGMETVAITVCGDSYADAHRGSNIIRSAKLITALTGLPTVARAWENLNAAAGDLRAAALADIPLVVTGRPPLHDETEMPHGVSSGHAYAVCMQDADTGWLENPRGSGDVGPHPWFELASVLEAGHATVDLSAPKPAWMAEWTAGRQR